MSDQTENPINQYSPVQEQSSFSSVPNPRDKKNKNKVLAALALILLLVVGAVSSFILLNQKQDTRNQASVSNGLVNVKLQKPAECAPGQTCFVDVVVNTGASNIDALQVKVLFDSNSMGAISDLTFKAADTPLVDVISGTSEANISDTPLDFAKKPVTTPALVINKNEVSANKEVLLVWTLANADLPFNSKSADYVLGRLSFKVNSANVAISKIELNLDKTFSKATLYKTGEDSLNTPAPLSIALASSTTPRVPCKSDANCAANEYCYYEPTPSGVQNFMANAYCKTRDVKPGACRTDADCKPDQYCYQTPQPSCPAGRACPMIAVTNACRDKNPTAAPTSTISTTPGRITCQNDSVCPTGQTCYQPPMETCPEGRVCPQVMPAKYCAVQEFTVTTTPRPSSTATPSPTATKTPTPPKSPTPTPTVVVIPSVTPISCAVPDCASGILKQMTVTGTSVQLSQSTSKQSVSSCPVYVCESIGACAYSYSGWSECNYGIQSRTLVDKNGCSETAPILKRSCSKTCTSDSNCSKGESCVMTSRMMGGPATTTDTSPGNVGYCQVVSTILADVNGDGLVNVLDLSYVIKNLFGSNMKADVNKDKVVDISDYSLVLKEIMNSRKLGTTN